MIIELCYVSKRFFTGGGVEANVNRQDCMISVVKRAELHGTTRLRDGGKTEIKKGIFKIMVTRKLFMFFMVKGKLSSIKSTKIS